MLKLKRETIYLQDGDSDQMQHPITKYLEKKEESDVLPCVIVDATLF